MCRVLYSYPGITHPLDGVLEVLVDLVEEVDVDLLQVVDGAELVQLVVHLVEDERLVVVGGVVLDDVLHGLRLQDVYHLFKYKSQAIISTINLMLERDMVISSLKS